MVDMRIWVDDVRPAPEGYALCYSVNEVIETIKDKYHITLDNITSSTTN